MLNYLNFANDLLKSKESQEILNNYSSGKSIQSKMINYEKITQIVKVMVLEYRKNYDKKQIVNIKDDFLVDPKFIKDINVNNLESAIKATVFLHLQQISLEYFLQINPVKKVKLVSKVSFNNNNEPINLTPTYNSFWNIISCYLVRNTLENDCEDMLSFHDHYISNLLLSLENFFNFHPESKDINLIIPVDFFVKFFFNFENHMLFWPEIINAPLNMKTFAFLSKAKEKLKNTVINYYDMHDMFNLKEIIHETCIKIVEFVDSTKLRDENKTAPFIPYKLNSNQSNFNSLSLSSSMGFNVKRTFNGIDINVEYQPIERFNNTKYKNLTSKTKKYSHQLTNEFAKIFSEIDKPITIVDNTGSQIDPLNYYRGEADTLIFKNSESFYDIDNKIYLMLCVDSSCSMNENKRNKISELLTIIMESVTNFPHYFSHLSAYTQNSSGNKNITLRKLIDSDTKSIKNPSSILNLTQKGVNYDTFAFCEILYSHKKHFDKKGITPILIGFGDSWPVTHSSKEGVKQEQKEMLNFIRKTYPDLLLMYLSFDKRYKPEELNYDYFIDATSNTTINSFFNNFTRMINNIVSNKS